MAKIPHGDYGTSSGESIVYPLEHMRETAARVLTKASYAQEQHDAVWGQLQFYIENNFDPGMQVTMMDLLKPYVARLRASYDWQVDLANALFDAVNLMDGTDTSVAQGFKPKAPGFGRDNIS